MSKLLRLIDKTINIRIRIPTVFTSIVFCVFYCISLNSTADTRDSDDTITVAVLIFSVEQRNVFEELATLFNKQNPSLKIKYISTNDANYKENAALWLETPGNIDVLNWPWPTRLHEYANAGWVEPVTDLWQMPDIKYHFNPAMKSLVSTGEQQFAIPYASGFWSIYYRESLFKELDITVPTNWQEFLVACQVLKINKINPIAIGTEESWPAAGWFDYFNLRINGLEFHNRLLRGEISFQSAAVLEVFQHWKQLIDNDYFTKDALALDFKQIIPLFYRNDAGMVLAGNFISTQISSRVRDDFKLFRFPIIKENIPIVEEAPTDMFIIPSGSNNKGAAKRFLYFLSQTEAQEKLSKAISFIPTNQSAKIESDYLLQEGQKILQNAAAYSQYFDRDAPENFSEEALKAFAQFIDHGEIPKVLERLENIRLKVFPIRKT